MFVITTISLIATYVPLWACMVLFIAVHFIENGVQRLVIVKLSMSKFLGQLWYQGFSYKLLLLYGKFFEFFQILVSVLINLQVSSSAELHQLKNILHLSIEFKGEHKGISTLDHKILCIFFFKYFF